ncbi:hypothetical protein [Geodermatophilus sp. URMC 65]
MTISPDDRGAGNFEHERRYLVADLAVLDGLEGDEIEQGYLFSAGGWAVRVRRTYRHAADGAIEHISAQLTAKGPRLGYSRPEYEVPLAPEHAESLIATAPHLVRKTRYPKVSEGETWVIDRFWEQNEGLVIAELEASPRVLNRLKRPWWAGDEITTDRRYQNENLAERPWLAWEAPEPR